MKKKYISPGIIEDIQAEQHCINITTTNAIGRVSISTSGACKVQWIRRDEEFSNHSYAVIPQDWEQLILEDRGDYYVVLGPYYEVRIYKDPLYVDFYTLDGAPLYIEERGLGVLWDQLGFISHRAIDPDEQFLGLGAKTGSLSKRGGKYVCWNTDSFGFSGYTDPVYASIPFYMGIRKGLPYGVFLDNTSKTHFNFGASNHRYSSMGAESGDLIYYFMYTGDIRGILKQYMLLTGKAEMPPIWSLGFQQCRYSYYPQQEVLKLARSFKDRAIPCDVIYLDIHYMDAYKVFTWHPTFFNDPKAMLRELSSMGFRTVAILDPGVKVEAGYDVYETGRQRDVFVRYIDGALMEGDVWPGKCHFPDFTKEDTRKWWADYVYQLGESGIDGFWNDMNEPAIWGNAFPDTTVFDYEGVKCTHLEAHNVYGMGMCMATHEGAAQVAGTRRTFLLTRAAYAGSQRVTAIWTGDNVSNDEHISVSARMVSNLGLAGMPFSGADVGGFVGECSGDLFKRWIALGAFQPLFRSHTMINSRSAEPWSFGEEVEEIARNFIRLRYKMLPLWQHLFYEYSREGVPPVRALCIDYWDEVNSLNPTYESQFLVGDHLLVCPVNSEESFKKVYLPAGSWFLLYNDQRFKGGECIVEVDPHVIPVFVKGNSAMMLQKEDGDQPLSSNISAYKELHIYFNGEDIVAQFYEDDGDLKDAPHNLFQLEVSTDKKNVKFFPVHYGFEHGTQWIDLFFHGIEMDQIIVNQGIQQKVEKTDYHFVEPISNFDPFANSKNTNKIIFGIPVVRKLDATQENYIEFVID